MTFELHPIIVTPEEIIAAAQKLVNKHAEDGPITHTADDYLVAVRGYLMRQITSRLYDIEWYANHDGLVIGREDDGFDFDLVDEATELVMPEFVEA